MRGFVPPDPETSVSSVHCAVIQAPNRSRRRFPAGIVEIMDDPESAVRQAKDQTNRHAARVLGPSKSSEGQYLYYLIEWLDSCGPV